MQLRSKIAAAGIVAGIAASAVILGVAAPAEAFAPSPVNPPKLNFPSSVVGAATTDGKSAAQLAGQIGSKAGVPAFKFGSMTKVVGGVSQVIQSYNLGTTIGGVIDQGLGIDVNGTVCSGTGNDFFGQVAQTLSGADCSNFDSPQIGYLANSDAVAQPPGFPTYPIAWSVGTGNGYVTCGVYVAYSCFSFDKTPQAVTGSQTIKVTNASSLGQGSMYFIGYCQNTSTLAVTGVNSVPQWFSFGTGALTASYVVTCPAGTVLYATTMSSSNLTGANPDTFAIGTTGSTLGQGNRSWYSGLSPRGSQYPGASGDPTRTLVCTITSTSNAVYQAVTTSFLETDPKWPAPNCPTLPAGITAGHMTVTMTGGPQILTLYDQDTTAAYQAMNSAYPLCAGQSCQLDLIDKAGSCYDGDQSRCATWFTDPTKSSDYTCKYGTYVAPIAECNVLANRFDPAKVSTGDAYANPGDGTDTGTQTSVKPSLGTGASADPATGQDRPDCWPSGWAAFNPVNWVLQPLQCAFSPRTSAVVATETQVSTAWKNSSVGVLGTAVSGFFLTSPTSGCQGITIDTSWIGGGGYIKGAPTSVHMLAACPGDYFEHIAPIVNGLLTAGIAIMAVLALARLLGRFAGYSGVSGE
ncbi:MULTISPECIES: hypothetical protein [unclassified Leifsonia]|uniref:hypothetical protein n=1 Tax=unclassified Leifsonia TaxID=2663824 RepID=UPI000B7E5B6D|nr:MULTISPECIES: hypothetical protein [unclassified Leifsonia]